MKSEKGITLTSLVIYVIVATIIIGSMAILSSSFFSNMNLVKNQASYAPEFNKFSMFFLEDVKENKNAEVTNTQVEFEDGTIYKYVSWENAIYRNDTKIAENIKAIKFTKNEIKPEENTHNTTKSTITVYIIIGENEDFVENIEYTLKYW